MLEYPKATEITITGKTGGSMVGGSPRSAMHTTETNPKWGFFRSKTYYHVQFLYNTYGKVEVLQSIDLSKASRALFNGPHPVQTNRQGTACPNVVIVGYAKDSPDLPKPLIEAMAEFFVWSDEQQRVPAVFPLAFQSGEAYGTSGVGRMTVAEWERFTGICGHQDVPDGNTHWDPGRIPVQEFKKAISAIAGGPMATTYRGVKNVPSNVLGKPVDWAKGVVDRNIGRGVIVTSDKAEDDWERDGRLWTYLDRLALPLEDELADKDDKINILNTKLTQHVNSHGSGGQQSGKDEELRGYLRSTPA